MELAGAVAGEKADGEGDDEVEAEEGDTGFMLLEKVGRKRGMMISGGEINTERAAITVLDEFRSGKLGRITLEMPPKEGE